VKLEYSQLIKMKLYRSNAFTEKQFINILTSSLGTVQHQQETMNNTPEFRKFKKNNILIYSTGPVGYMGSIPKKQTKVTIAVSEPKSHPINSHKLN